MNDSARPLGVQWTAELTGCDPLLLDDVAQISHLMLSTASRAQTTIINSQFHKFSPQGVSGVVIIAESHLAVHTWPEVRYAALDMFTCGDNLRVEEALRWLICELKATRVELERKHRGAARLFSPVQAAPHEDLISLLAKEALRQGLLDPTSFWNLAKRHEREPELTPAALFDGILSEEALTRLLSQARKQLSTDTYKG